MNALSPQLPIPIYVFPVAPIKKSSFDKHLAKLRKSERLSIEDIPLQYVTQPREDATVFLQFCGPTFVDESNHHGHPLREYPLASIGIVDCPEWTDLSDAHIEYTQLSESRPSSVPLISRSYAFDPGPTHRDIQNLIVVPDVDDDKQQFYISALLAELVSSVVSQLNSFMSSLERPISSSTLPFRSDSSRQISTLSLPKPDSLPQQDLSSTTSEGTATPSRNSVLERIRSNITSPIYPGSQVKPGNKLMSGRAAKVKGDICLASGQWSDAIKLYRECINISKSTHDSVWHAAALEGTASVQILQAWQLTNAKDHAPNSRPSFLELHHVHSAYAQAVTTYSSPSAPSNAAEPSPPLVFALACLRAARFFYVVWLCDGWDEHALSMLVDFEGTKDFREEQSKKRHDHGGSSGITRSEAAHYATLPLSPVLMERLSVQQRFFVYSNAAVMLGLLRCSRKRAVVLRLIAAMLAERGMDVKDMIREVLHGYGISDDFDSDNTSENEQTRWSIVSSSKGISEPLPPKGWQELQAAIMHDAISIAELIPDYALAVKLAVNALPLMSPIEQRVVKESIDRVYGAARRRKAIIELPYWGPKELVVSLEIVSMEPEMMPVKIRQSTKSEQENKGPFIYNPSRDRSSANNIPLLAQNETSQVIITLRNSYYFPLTLKDVRLSFEGAHVDSSNVSLTLPPCSFHTLALDFTPRETGQLKITGCQITLRDCKPMKFYVPAWSHEEDVRLRRHQSLQIDKEKMKEPSLSNRTSDQSFLDPKTVKCLEFNVIESLPLLKIKETSLAHDSLMLYDGETSSIKISLFNDSELDVSYINLSFTDTHTTEVNSLLNESELDEATAYDLEYDMKNRPIFSWEPPEDFHITPGDSQVVEIPCVGKVGCTYAIIRILYGDSKDGDGQWGRRIELPVMITVRPSLIPQSLQVLPLESFSGDRVKESVASRNTTRHTRSRSVIKRSTLDPSLEEEFLKANGAQHCLVKIDVENVCSVAFDVDISRNDSGVMKGNKQRIEPSSTGSLLIRVDRLYLDSLQASRPIPILSNRQYVVSKKVVPVEEEQKIRELFWYRQELCGKLRVSWREAGTLRKGAIRLNRLPLTRPSFNKLRVENVKIDMSLEEIVSDTDVSKHAESPSPGVYYSVVVNIHNCSGRVLNLRAVLSFYPRVLEHYAILDGTGEEDLGNFDTNSESRQTRFTIFFLASGTFELVCSIYGKESTEVLCRGRKEIHVG